MTARRERRSGADSVHDNCSLLVEQPMCRCTPKTDNRAVHWHVQIADFGLSRVMVETSISTGTYGTVTHMPPELLTTVRLLLLSAQSTARLVQFPA